MISFMISVVPPKMAMTGVGSDDSCVSRGLLPVYNVHKEDLAGDQRSLARSPPGSESPRVGTAVSHSSTRAVITPR
jgi:hypothetical protein